MLRRIDMVAVYVQDWPAAVDFYSRVLGFDALHVEEHHQPVRCRPCGRAG